MGGPALGSRFAIRMATYYTIVLSMFIFGCISWQYRLMVYHVSLTHVDITKVMPLRRVWDIFTQISHNLDVDGLQFNSSSVTRPDAERQLDELLSRYRSSNDLPIYVYKGLFDADIILSPKIQEFVSDSITKAFQRTLNIDSVDLVTILYSLGVLCYDVLYHATTKKLKNNDNMSEDTMITSKHIT